MKQFLSFISFVLIILAILTAIAVGSLRDYGEVITFGDILAILALLGGGALTNAVARAQQ
jgi:uncharacterized membrane protein YjjP (DUF1212 family)